MSHPLSLACLQLCERMCKQQWRDRAVRHPKAEAPPHGLTWPSVQDVRVAQAKGAVFTERQRKGVEELPSRRIAWTTARCWAWLQVTIPSQKLTSDCTVSYAPLSEYWVSLQA